MHLIARLLNPAPLTSASCVCQDHPNFWMYSCD